MPSSDEPLDPDAVPVGTLLDYAYSTEAKLAVLRVLHSREAHTAAMTAISVIYRREERLVADLRGVMARAVVTGQLTQTALTELEEIDRGMRAMAEHRRLYARLLSGGIGTL